MKKWDEQEKQDQIKVVNLSDFMTEKDHNIEKLIKWQMDKHVAGTYYSDKYLSEIRKIIKSKTGRFGDNE
jgi:hypothetical protein